MLTTAAIELILWFHAQDLDELHSRLTTVEEMAHLHGLTGRTGGSPPVAVLPGQEPLFSDTGLATDGPADRR